MTLLPLRTFSGRRRTTLTMGSRSRKITLLAACALLLSFAAAPAALAAPASDEYVLEVPNAGETAAERESGDSRPLTGTAGSGDALLPVLLFILGGTAAGGAGIALIRKRRQTE